MCERENIKIYKYKVETTHSALHQGSGDLEVLSTPSLIAFMENGAKELVKERLEDGTTTVGININVNHLQATKIGDEVNVEVKLVSIDNSILSFEIKAYDSWGLIGEGTHKRCVVNVEKFLSKVNG